MWVLRMRTKRVKDSPASYDVAADRAGFFNGFGFSFVVTPALSNPVHFNVIRAGSEETAFSSET